MEAKALTILCQTPRAKRLDIVAAGLAKLVEHVGALKSELDVIIESKQHRSARIIDGLAQEEAAKFLILLDIVRGGVADDTLVATQVKAFYRHLSRCIVAEIATYRPADFGEAREAVDRLRESHYLDGPNDTDWVFRNRLESTREEAMYVDYVRTDDGDRWVSPGDHLFELWRASSTLDLVLALGRCGVGSRDGLDIVESLWTGRTFKDDDHWQVARELNERTVTLLIDAGLASGASGRDRHLVVDQWPFPMGALDLRPVAIDLGDLRAEQERHLDALAREYYGY